jgi:hypothetical protein
VSDTITTSETTTVLTVSGNTGVAQVLSGTLAIGDQTVPITTDATGAWSYSEAPPAPGTYAVVATFQPPAVTPPPIVATTSVTIAYPPGVTIAAPPVVVGTQLTPGTPVVAGNYVDFPFTLDATLATLVTWTVDGVGKSTGWKNPGTTGNTFSEPIAGLTAGTVHTAEISIGNPATSSITWDFVYEPAAGGGSGGGGTAPPPPDILITRPTFPAPIGTGQLGSVMQRANGIATPSTSETCLLTFPEGALPAGSGVALGPHPAQIDVHTTWPDGSARCASLTALAWALAADASTIQMLTAATPITGTPVTLGFPTGLVTVALEIGGVAYNFDVGTVLAGVKADWLSGPIASEGRATVPVTGFLRLVVDYHRLADGHFHMTIGFNGDVAFEPTSAAAQFSLLEHINYLNLDVGWQSLLLQSATVTYAGTAVKQVTNLTQYQYTVWHVEIDSRPAVPEMLFDVAKHAKSGLMPRFDLTGVSNDTIAGYYASMTPANGFGVPSTPPATAPTGYYPNPAPTLGWGGLTTYMGETGGRNDIGEATDASCAWAITYDPRMREYCLAQAEGAASAPWHLFDGPNGQYINTGKRPTLWTNMGALQQSGTTGLPPDQQIYGSEWELDAAHMPNACLIPYLLTGRRHYLDELIAQATWAVMQINGRPGDLVVDQGQTREQAWCMRQLIYASVLAADADPLKAWFQQVVADNIAYINAIKSQGELSTYWCYPNGLTEENGNTGNYILAPWQVDFGSLALVTAVDCGIPGAAQALAACAGFTAGRFVALGIDGLDYYYTTAPGGVPITTWAALKAEQVANGAAASSNASLPPDCSDQYVGYALQTMTQMQRALAAAGETAAAATCAQALAIVTQLARTFLPPEFQQDNPSFAITGS